MAVVSALRITARPARGFVAMGLVFGSFAALLPVLKAQIGADDATFGLALLGSPAGLILTLWLAPLFDRRLAALSLPVSAAFLGATMVLTGFTAGPVAFFVAMVLVGASSGTLDIISNARVADMEAAHRAPLMNANHGMFSVAYALSAVATGAAREAGFGPVAIFACVAVLVWLLAFGNADRPGRGRRGPHTRSAAARNARACRPAMRRDRPDRVFFVEAVVESWSALHVERTLQGGAAEGAFGPAILGLTMAAGRFSGQIAAGRFGDTAIITTGSVMACLGAGLAAAAQSPWAAYLGFGLMGLGMSVVGPMALALVGRIVPPSRRTAAVARVNVMGFGRLPARPGGHGADLRRLRPADRLRGGRRHGPHRAASGVLARPAARGGARLTSPIASGFRNPTAAAGSAARDWRRRVSPQSAIVVSSSLWMISSALVTPA